MPITSGDDHSCFGKQREIEKRLQIPLGLEAHDLISEMCKLWGTANADEFYEKMNAMGDDELRAAVEEAKRRLRRKKVGLSMTEEIYNTVTAYA
jgi:hypothetical protein